MQDMKLVEALNQLREETRDGMNRLRRELREDVRDVRDQALQAHLSLLRRLVWAILVLGLALGGKDLLEVALGVL